MFIPDMIFAKNNKAFMILAAFGAVGLFLIFYLLISADQGINFSVKHTTVNQVKNSIVKTDDKASDSGENVSVKMEEISNTDHLQGLIDAPIKIIVYSEYDCLFCADFNDTLKKVKSEFGEKVVVAYRHFPQRQHVDSFKAAVLSECAAEQGKFQEMNDKLFNLVTAEKLSNIDASVLAKELDLDEKNFVDCAATERYKDKISSGYDAARNFGIIGAPSSFVNGEVLPGAVQFEDFTDSAGIQREGMRSLVERLLFDF